MKHGNIFLTPEEAQDIFTCVEAHRAQCILAGNKADDDETKRHHFDASLRYDEIMGRIEERWEVKRLI